MFISIQIVNLIFVHDFVLGISLCYFFLCNLHGLVRCGLEYFLEVNSNVLLLWSIYFMLS
jgi:hypothetical protein